MRWNGGLVMFLLIIALLFVFVIFVMLASPGVRGSAPAIGALPSQSTDV